jgi:c-di-AMP phosphodiesterase-like protein
MDGIWKFNLKNKMNTIHWTRDELVAYILLFAANSDFKEDQKERKIIISKVDLDTFQDIHDEFNSDNDYQGIKKIMTSLEQHNYEKSDTDALMEDIRVLFFSDGKFDIKEKNMLKCLNRLFKTL